MRPDLLRGESQCPPSSLRVRTPPLPVVRLPRLRDAPSPLDEGVPPGVPAAIGCMSSKSLAPHGLWALVMPMRTSARLSRWVWALVVAVVTSGLGVAINLATDMKGSWWAWLVVGTLTVISGGITAWRQGSDAPQHLQPPTAPAASTHNEVSGTVQGNVIQARTISGPMTITDHSAPVTQNAVASGNATVNQAGRDMNIHQSPPK
jgi:hypothetical protein